MFVWLTFYTLKHLYKAISHVHLTTTHIQYQGLKILWFFRAITITQHWALIHSQMQFVLPGVEINHHWDTHTHGGSSKIEFDVNTSHLWHSFSGHWKHVWHFRYIVIRWQLENSKVIKGVGNKWVNSSSACTNYRVMRMRVLSAYAVTCVCLLKLSIVPIDCAIYTRADCADNALPLFRILTITLNYLFSSCHILLTSFLPGY